MSAAVIIRCDVVHPDRTPTRCRAFYVATTTDVSDAYDEGEAAGWNPDYGGRDMCPSCSTDLDAVA